MPNNHQPSEESRAGDGMELSVTEARAGVRRGVSKIMVISTLLAIVAMGAVWLFMAHRPPQAPHLASAHALAIPSQADMGH